MSQTFSYLGMIRATYTLINACTGPLLYADSNILPPGRFHCFTNHVLVARD